MKFRIERFSNAPSLVAERSLPSYIGIGFAESCQDVSLCSFYTKIREQENADINGSMALDSPVIRCRVPSIARRTSFHTGSERSGKPFNDRTIRHDDVNRRNMNPVSVHPKRNRTFSVDQSGQIGPIEISKLSHRIDGKLRGVCGFKPLVTIPPVFRFLICAHELPPFCLFVADSIAQMQTVRTI